MGCSQSKIESEEPVVRCKERKQLMKESVGARNAFAAAHSAYITLLKNTGAALNDYGQGEASERPVHGLAPTGQFGGDPLPPAPPLPFAHPLPPPSPDDVRFRGLLNRSASAPANTLLDIQHQLEENKTPEATTACILEGAEDEEYEEEEPPVEVTEVVPSPPRPPPRPPAPADPPPPPSPGQQSPWGFFDYDTYYEHRPSVDQPGPPHHDHDHDHDHDQDQEQSHSHDEASTDTDTDTQSEHPSKALQKSVPMVDKEVAEKEGNDMQLSVAPHRGRGRHLLQVLQEIDDQFLRASESGLAVSKMLEANRLHYHSNFADNKVVNLDLVTTTIKPQGLLAP